MSRGRMTADELYAQGRCTKCGRPNTSSRRQCEACRARIRLKREAFAAEGRCSLCGKVDAMTESGHRQCGACRMYQSIWQSQEGNIRKRQVRERARYADRVEKHLCTMCGSELPEDCKCRLCDDCRAQVSSYMWRRNRIS